MEEDDPTPSALPRWIELEYKVGVVATSRASGQQVLTTISSHAMLIQTAIRTITTPTRVCNRPAAHGTSEI
jgi:hypothetical protein